MAQATKALQATREAKAKGEAAGDAPSMTQMQHIEKELKEFEAQADELESEAKVRQLDQ